ncbi:hypothetical protein [Desmospora profundinema]|uniref:Uncharacterized protein n=1 Tax=Desmospora profundinema TaxID=1571184 RepID=A0ABU1IRJ1_9BACL|nr:hypothetical protein [Desmospora profundinema]MDR6226779.1 hypothetical protein [Desmospora profundinema]
MDTVGTHDIGAAIRRVRKERNLRVEDVYCPETSKIQEGEYPVIDWDRFGNSGNTIYRTFLSFLVERFPEAIDNLE